MSELTYVMRKLNSRKTFGLLLAPLALAAMPVASFVLRADENGSPAMSWEVVDDPVAGRTFTLKVDANSASGIGSASYTGTDSIGNVYGVSFAIGSHMVEKFDEAGNSLGQVEEPCIDELMVYGAITKRESIVFPDTIAVEYEGKLLKAPAERYVFRHYSENQGTHDESFPGSSSLKEVYVPATATQADWYGENYVRLRNFHFCSETVPRFSFNDGADGRINLYVPSDLFHLYAQTMEGYNTTVWSEAPLSPVYVNVAEPGTLGDEIARNVENLSEVRWLVVTGNPNDQDLRIMRRLPRLEILDLSQTSGLTTMVGCNELKYLRDVKLPEGVVEIGTKAFQSCTALDSIHIPASIKAIREYAFDGSAIRKINLEDVNEIDGRGFAATNLDTIRLANIREIGWSAFNDCHNLKSVEFGNNLKTIDNYAFSYCGLKSVVIPDNVSSISHNAFYNLEEVVIGANVEYIENGAFSYSYDVRKPKKVMTYTLFPTQYSGFSSENTAETVLYVPALTYNEYLLADGWTMFKDIRPMDEPLTDLTIERAFNMTRDEGIADKAKMSLYRLKDNDYNGIRSDCGHLTVKRNLSLNLGHYSQLGCYDSRDIVSGNWLNNMSYTGSTIIPKTEVTAENVEVKMALRTGTWHFLSFPFDVNVKDIVVEDDALWVVRKYSGSDRAALNENTWQNMTDDTVLKAGEGYIFHCAKENGERVAFTFRPAAGGNAFFARETVSKELASYPSEFPHNASWNLVGNTFPAFMTIKGLGFQAPVTVWENNSYYAYSPVDDEYVFSPFQAFFVQRQDTDGGNVITLDPEGRAHSIEAAAAIEMASADAPATRAGVSEVRSLFNISLAGENGSDRTRLVVNEAADMAYESSRDAAKFMSSEKSVPQIFVINGGNRMAIDERPLASGEIQLGSYFGKTGDYTISLSTRNAEAYSALLIDRKTGITTDLLASAYTFTADAGTDNDRFILRVMPLSSEVEGIAGETAAVSVDGNVLCVNAPEAIDIVVASADGKVVASEKGSAFSMTLGRGIYVVKAGTRTVKVNIGK